MLPDYPKVKGDLSDRLQVFLRARVDHHLGPLSQIARVRFFEGDSRELTRPSGETEPSGYEEIRSSFTVRDEELPTLTLDAVLGKFDQAAQGLAQEVAKSVYSSVSQAVEKVGNVVDAKGKVTGQTILDLLSSLEIDFNQDGTPRMPALHIHPSQAETVKAAFEELDADREMKKKLDQIIERKREEWRAREASRKLVG